MPSEAQRQPEDEPEPGRADLDARAARLLAAHLDLIMRIDGTLAAWGQACPRDSMAVPVLRDLFQLVIDGGRHAEELRADMAAYTATAGSLEAAFTAGRAAERAAAEAPPAPPVPGPRHAAGRRLRVVQGGTVAAFAAATARGASWAGHHAAATALIAGGTVATTALLLPGSPVSPLGGHHAPGSAPAPSASIVAAVPIAGTGPQQKLIANVTRPKVTTMSSGPLATAGPVPPAAPPASGPGPQQYQPPPPAVLSASPLAADLSSLPQATVTLTASNGPVRWHAWCTGPDVSIGDANGNRSGTADPADPVDLTVSLAPVQDGAQTATCHVWPGDFRVTVTLPPPPPPAPSPAGTPTDTPSPQPS